MFSDETLLHFGQVSHFFFVVQLPKNKITKSKSNIFKKVLFFIAINIY